MSASFDFGDLFGEVAPAYRTADLEAEVITRVLDQGAEDRYSELDRGCGDLRLRYCSLSVGRQHEHMFVQRADGIGQPTLRAGASPQRFSSL